ncbi:hypothetical protein WBP07_11445 [Novosphingobium sp. BL-8A]|uniref:hypothetical protein n=1 Tax=Novosphingobium sp. BL-8A TaxID=3127639 RepID=UPI00375735D1
MAETERKHKGSQSLGKLELALEAHEQLFGCVVKLEAIGNFTVATYNDDSFPAAHSLALFPMIGESAPSPPGGVTHLFNGEAVLLSEKMKVAVYRTS